MGVLTITVTAHLSLGKNISTFAGNHKNFSRNGFNGSRKEEEEQAQC